jgi:hypothetical protein
MTSKLHRDHSAETAMLAYRTGLSAANMQGLDRGPNFKPRGGGQGGVAARW